MHSAEWCLRFPGRQALRNAAGGKEFGDTGDRMEETNRANRGNSRSAWALKNKDTALAVDAGTASAAGMVPLRLAIELGGERSAVPLRVRARDGSGVPARSQQRGRVRRRTDIGRLEGVNSQATANRVNS